MIRPHWASVYSENPAYTSAMWLNSRFSSLFSESHAPAGAFFGTYGVQSGLESRTSSLTTPL
jgi:hypothetical protein